MSQVGATSATGPGSASTGNLFGNSAVVSTATLASNVTGNTINMTAAAGPTSGTLNNSMSTGDGAFQNFAGLQSLNMNTGAAASQNSAVNVSVSAGTINMGGGG